MGQSPKSRTPLPLAPQGVRAQQLHAPFSQLHIAVEGLLEELAVEHAGRELRVEVLEGLAQQLGHKNNSS